MTSSRRKIVGVDRVNVHPEAIRTTFETIFGAETSRAAFPFKVNLI